MKLIQGIVKSVKVNAGNFMRVLFTGRAGESFGGSGRPFHQLPGVQSVPRKGDRVIALREGQQVFIVAGSGRQFSVVETEGDVAIASSEDDYVLCKGEGGIEVHSSTITLGTGESLDALVKKRVLSALKGHGHIVVTDPKTGALTAGASEDLLLLDTNSENYTSTVEAE